jgi:hypothetical protein
VGNRCTRRRGALPGESSMGVKQISPTLLHLAIDRLTAILGFIELAEIEKDEAKRKKQLERARTYALDLVSLLRDNRKPEPERRKKS